MVLDNVFSFTFTGREPLGTCSFFVVLMLPDALSDGRIDFGDILASAVQLFGFNP